MVIFAHTKEKSITPQLTVKTAVLEAGHRGLRLTPEKMKVAPSHGAATDEKSK